MNSATVGGLDFDSVYPRDVHTYLLYRGWRWQERFGDAGDYYVSPDGDAEVLVPAEVLADYGRRVSDVLDSLSRVESRDRRTVLIDISLVGFDLVRVSLPGNSGAGSVGVDSVVESVRAARGVIAASAAAAVRPQPFFRPGGMSQVSDYMKRVRFGHTEPGSFVVSLLCPVPPDLGLGQASLLSGEVESDPFGRRVTRKLVSGLRGVRESLLSSARGGGFAAFEERVSEGVSANLCQSVAGLVGADHGGAVAISVNWAAARRVPGEAAEIRFTSGDESVLREAARSFRAGREYLDETVEGYVRAMAREYTEQEGLVVLKAVVDGSMRSVRVRLNEADYSRMLDAHDQRLVVSLVGDLSREGNGWVMGNPRDLLIVADDD